MLIHQAFGAFLFSVYFKKVSKKFQKSNWVLYLWVIKANDMKNTITMMGIIGNITPILVSINSEIAKMAENIKIAIGVEAGKLYINRVEFLKSGKSKVSTLSIANTIDGAVLFLRENNIYQLLKS